MQLKPPLSLPCLDKVSPRWQSVVGLYCRVRPWWASVAVNASNHALFSALIQLSQAKIKAEVHRSWGKIKLICNYMKKLLNKVIGTTDNYLFEEVLYNGMCFFAFLGGFAAAVINLIYGMYAEIIFALLVAVFDGAMYYLGRFKKRYYFMSLYIFTVLLTSISYFRGYGFQGPISFYLLVIFIYAMVYNPVKLHVKVFAFYLFILGALFFIEYQFPQLILNPYKTKDVLHNDIVLGILIGVFMLFFGIYFLRQSYDNEKEKNQQQKALLEKNANEKTMFFINLSHEIKTPLTLAENYLEKYIQEKGEDEKLLIIRQNIQKMRRDILDYLNVENIERGNASYKDLATVPLSKLLQEKINLFAGYTRNKGVALDYDIYPDVFVQTNLKGIDQVLNNLLENAAKYTPEGEKINICLKTEKSKAKLIVQNGGAVISPEQLSHLFDPFYQLSNEKQNAQGIGMGLFIVKKVLDSTGGQIEVDSSKELGVIFTITFPMGTKDEATDLPAVINTIMPTIGPTIPKATDSQYEMDKPCLMLVEDNNELLNYLVGELRGHYNVFVADNGLTAINRLEKIPVPELIISDIMMDTMDGYELLENEKFSHIPFIFLTAKNTSQEKILGLGSGALDFITKPFSIDELRMKIKTVISQKARISDAAIREIKKRFTDDYHIRIKQKNDEIFNVNTLKYNITAREREVILHIQKGLTNKKIGEQLHIAENTVTTHLQNIYEKTGTSSKIELLNRMFSYMLG